MLFKKKALPILIALLMVFAVMPAVTGQAYAAGTSIKDGTITISPLTYNGKVQKPNIKIVIGQVTLAEGTDYTVDLQNPSSINAGKYKVTLTGKGNYSGKVNTQYTIDPKKIAPTVKLSSKSFTYNGSVQKPSVTDVLDDTVKLTGSDYSVSYSSTGKDVGSYGITVTLKGNYSGTKKVTYKINPKGTSIKSLTKGSKLIKVKWGKQSELMSQSRITGYQVKLATNSKFTKNKKLYTIKGYGKTSKKATKLKGGKKYYVKVRTYKVVNGKKYYSKWSKKKTVTTKK